jgi:putative Ca2+/H+ antiporter (TMEM165/GDT1 family)
MLELLKTYAGHVLILTGTRKACLTMTYVSVLVGTTWKSSGVAVQLNIIQWTEL